MLSRRARWRRVVVLERRESLSFHEPDKAFMYMIDHRGRALTDATGVTDAVAERGLTTQEMSLMQVAADGRASVSKLPIKDDTTRNVWLPRWEFLSALHTGLAAPIADGVVQLMHGTEVTSVHLADPAPAATGASSAPGAASPAGQAQQAQQPSTDAPAIVVYALHAASGERLAFAPTLLLGADGAGSCVRAALEAWAPRAGLPPDHFARVVLDSASAGLRYKVLHLPPNPPFHAVPSTGLPFGLGAPGRHASDGGGGGGSGGGGAGGAVVASAAAAAATGAAVAAAAAAAAGGTFGNSCFGFIRGVPAPPRRAMRLGMLPMRDPTARRAANVILPGDHEFWAATATGPALRDFLQASFPQLDIAALMSPESLDATAAARGGVFPRPQYARHFTAVLPEPCAPQAQTRQAQQAQQQGAQAAREPGVRGCGVALLGDAVHAFPPDLGQGVNSSLQHVMVLAQALDEADDHVAAALPLYEQRSAPEAAALVQLQTFSFPHQYNHASIQYTMWAINFMLRASLSWVMPALFSPHSFILIQKPGLSYTEILRRSHETTARLWALAAVLAAASTALAL